MTRTEVREYAGELIELASDLRRKALFLAARPSDTEALRAVDKAISAINLADIAHCMSEPLSDPRD